MNCDDEYPYLANEEAAQAALEGLSASKVMHRWTTWPELTQTLADVRLLLGTRQRLNKWDEDYALCREIDAVLKRAHGEPSKS